MHRKNLLSSFSLLLLAGASALSLRAQGPMRGEAEIEATQRSVEMVIIVEEIEQAGFVLDVEEGFDEEWEEGTWIDTDFDDLMVTRLGEEDADLLDLEDMDSIEEALETDEQGFEEVDFLEEAGMDNVASIDVALGEETESEDLYALATEDEIEEGGSWWEESSRDDSWDELLDEMELEDLENSYEEEDMETMEAMFE